QFSNLPTPPTTEPSARPTQPQVEATTSTHHQEEPYHLRHASAPLPFVDLNLDDLLRYLDDGILHPVMGDLDEIRRKEMESLQRQEELAQQVSQLGQQMTQMAQQQLELRSFVQRQAQRQDEQFSTLMNYIYEVFIQRIPVGFLALNLQLINLN
uniref:hypothetical protein n=1 Tax=Picosynechococcus sp. (strain ATCC 27264 / PCC 7002 / PR-6) TaxID=32049 RepID=UPI001C3C45FD